MYLSVYLDKNSLWAADFIVFSVSDESLLSDSYLQEEEKCREKEQKAPTVWECTDNCLFPLKVDQLLRSHYCALMAACKDILIRKIYILKYIFPCVKGVNS